MTLKEWENIVTSTGRTFMYNVENGEVYTAIGICHEPTVILKNIESGAVEHHAHNCLNIQKFKKMEVK